MTSGSHRLRALRDSDVIISMHKQAALALQDRKEARHVRLDLDSVNRLREARDWIGQILEIERRR